MPIVLQIILGIIGVLTPITFGVISLARSWGTMTTEQRTLTILSLAFDAAEGIGGELGWDGARKLTEFRRNVVKMASAQKVPAPSPERIDEYARQRAGSVKLNGHAKPKPVKAASQ